MADLRYWPFPNNKLVKRRHQNKRDLKEKIKQKRDLHYYLSSMKEHGIEM